jgi:CPA1 family monovalent cation:H+ antiporter
MAGAVPTFVLVVLGSIAVGWLLAWPVGLLIAHIEHAPTSVILQFVITFGIWLAAERLGLSAVVTIVVFGMSAARRSAFAMPARLRVPSFAIWESVTFVLNVLAFTLIGLQLRPILEGLKAAGRFRLVDAALAILAVVIVIRLVWVMTYTLIQLRSASRVADPSMPPLTFKAGLVIGWSGMRGIVTLAAALALPAGFPYRDFIQLTGFIVVLGTLVIQGLTLRPLLVLLHFPKDSTVEREIALAREAALKAAMSALKGDETAPAQRLRLEYQDALREARRGSDPRERPDNALRQRVVPASRRAIDDLRDSGAIGDEAYRLVEEELDWLELSSRPRQ